VSPTQTSARNPCSTAAFVFNATVSSVSPKCVRRSLWPISTRLAPTSRIIGAEISPVQAPALAQCMFCAPMRTRVPARMAATSAIVVKGGMTKGRAASVAATGEAASASAKARACGRVLFIFQLVPIQGVLTDISSP